MEWKQELTASSFLANHRDLRTSETWRVEIFLAFRVINSVGYPVEETNKERV